MVARLFLADVCLIWYEEVLNDGGYTTFHGNLFPFLTSVVYINHRTFRLAESWLDACLFHQLKYIRELENFDDLGICDPDFYLLHVCGSIY